MGITCIKTESSMKNSVNFTYQNMIKYITMTPVEKDYQFVQQIGRGSFSQVFRGKQKRTGKIRAIKKIDRRKHAKIQPLLLNEFDILRQLDHPNVLKIFQIYQEINFYYIVTELCTGKELFEVLSEVKSFNEINAANIFVQLISACRYLHEKQVMHRDLKPQNIIYDIENNSLKLVDFGSATRFETTDLVNRRRVGTSYYIAPQVLDRRYNQKCDVWSAGIILYILLSGEPPFMGHGDDEIIKNIKKGDYSFKKPVWKIISPEAKLIITEMIERNPEKRPEMEQIMQCDWIRKSLKKQKLTSHSQKNLAQFLGNMKKFKDLRTSQIQEGFLIFMVNFVKDGKDETEMMKCFKALDLNGDGVLSLQELQKGLAEYLKINEKQALSIAKGIFKKVDTNNSGFIDYSQFVISAANMEMMVTQQNLETAFDCMDADGNGSLSVNQIRQRLGDNISKETYVELLKQFNKNKNGEITKKEFTLMMKKLLKKV